MTIFNALIFSEAIQLVQRTGNNADELYIWMLSLVHEKVGHFNGYVLNLNTGIKVKTFCSSSIEC